MSSFDKIIYLLRHFGGLFWQGTLVTLLLAVVGTFAGLLFGLLLSMARNLHSLPTDSLFTRVWKRTIMGLSLGYIELFRGTPMMVQSIIIYFGGKALGIPWTYLSCGLVVISINTAAYMAEIIRSGINGVDKGQMEAARSLGMTHTQAMVRVIFPQALKNAIPALGNEFITNIKDSSVLNVITVSELFMAAKIASNNTYFFVESYLIIAMVYLLLTISASRLLKMIERHLSQPYSEKKEPLHHVIHN